MTAITDLPARGSRRIRPGLLGVALAFAAAATAVYAVAFVVHLGSVIATIYSLADTDIAPYLTQRWAHAASGSHMLTGNSTWYAGYLVMRLLGGLPDHRGLWEIAPWVTSGLASAWVGWTTARAVGPRAGLLVTAALICTGTMLLPLQLSWSIHAVAYAYILLFGGLIVWLAGRPMPTRPGWFWALVTVLTALVAVGLASDELVLLGGLIPFVIAALPAGWSMPEGRGRFTLAVATVAVGGYVVSVGFGSLMRHVGILADRFPISLSPLGDLHTHALYLLQSVFVMLNGYLHEGGVSPTGWLGYLSSGVILFLLALGAVLVARQTIVLVAPLVRRGSVRPKREGEGEGAASSSPAPLLALTTYWSVGLVVLSAAFVFSTIGLNIETKRYLTTVSYAVVILGITGGMTLRRPALRALTAIGSGLLILAGAIGLFGAQIPKSYAPWPTVRLADAVNALARREHVQVVYAGYWDAFPFGWLAPDAVPAYPVAGCGTTLCAPALSQLSGIGIDTWYRPRPHARTMLVLDSVLNGADAMPSTAPSYLGAPLGKRWVIDGRLDVYLYDYDIAAKLGTST